jgi:selenocysteine lyase/cysteine desulfurase
MKCRKDEFQLDNNYTYLNCAYKSPFTHTVFQAGKNSLEKNLCPNLITADDYFDDAEKVKKNFAKIIHENESQRIAIIPSVSYGMANVANNIHLQQDENIITITEQFPSNYYIWKKLCEQHNAQFITVPPPNVFEKRAEIWNERVLEAINSKTKVVALNHVHWTDGTIFDLLTIRKRCDDVGALLIIDGTQSVGAMEFDNSIIKADAVICAGYKWLMGPYNYGVGYYGAYFDNGNAIEESWKNRERSHVFSELANYTDKYKPFANKYSVGESGNFILSPMLNAALEQILVWGVNNIQSYCKNLTDMPIKILREKGFFIEETEYCARHLFGIIIQSEEELIYIFNQLRKNNIVVSIRGNCIRVSPHIYNDENDMNKLLNCF